MVPRGRSGPATDRPLLAEVLDRLEDQHGAPRPAVPRTPLEWILWENVAYLVDDARRELAYRTLARRASIA